MKTAELELVGQDESRSKPRSSRSGSFGRALGGVEPQQLSQSDLAYLRFILLALHSSMKEVRHSVGNRALIIDACVGMDLLIENAERRFGFPLIPAEHQATPVPPRQHDPAELTLETPSSESASSPRPETAATPNPPVMNSRSSSRREFNPQETLRQGICGYCGWSWSVGKDGQILCLNPESPYAYDIVPLDLTCPEEEPNPEQA